MARKAKLLCYGVGMGKHTQIGYLDAEAFIAALERASEQGGADFVAANIGPLEKVIAQV